MQVWEEVLDSIRDKLNSQAYETWFAPIEFDSSDDTTLRLRVPNKFFKEWLSNNYSDLIQEEFRIATGQRPQVAFVVSEPTDPRLAEVTPPATVPPQPPTHSFENPLNPRYTFESFVVGPSNQLPHAASLAVTELLGTKYNPLFIYGGVGLGKTHLVHAIGNNIRARWPSANICYISSEQFMNEFISSMRNDKMEIFRRRFRNDCDVLLMDDIQFIAGKDRTQDEFFHTFNSLHQNAKQIVLTSDKYPQEIPDLEERLRSRFQWGLIADIQPPELETRLAILKKNAEDEGIALPDDVALFLASSIKSNVRELEGSLISLAAHASLERRRIDLDFAKQTLKKVIALHQTPLTVESVQETVCKHFNLSLADLKGAKRQRSIAFPRQLAMYICRTKLNTSYPELGERFGGKDHTTALAACRKIEKLVSEDVDVRSRVEALERLLGL